MSTNATPASDDPESTSIRERDTTKRVDKWLFDSLETPLIKNLKGAAATFDRKRSGTQKTENIVADYPWTTSNVKKRWDIPSITLSEHRSTESAIVRNVKFYGSGLKGLNNTDPQSVLEVYDEIFPDNPTNNKYIFPYFSKTAFELGTSRWEQMDDIATSIKELGEGASSFLKELGGFGKAIGGALDKAGAAFEFGQAVGTLALKKDYPVVGVFDRPRIFTSHSERSITIEFPLYNTIDPDHWMKNHGFIYKFMSQNLYIKRDFITGIPPCFYRVHVPQQYFCFAACVTKIDVQNLGNIRILKGFRVPDAYQVSITLEEMVMPSLNQFQALINGDADKRVKVIGKAQGQPT